MLCEFCRTRRVTVESATDSAVSLEAECSDACVLCVGVLARADVLTHVRKAAEAHALWSVARALWSAFELFLNVPVAFQLRDALFTRAMQAEHGLTVHVVPFREAVRVHYGQLLSEWLGLTLTGNQAKADKAVVISLCFKTSVDDPLMRRVRALHEQLYPTLAVGAVSKRNSTKRNRLQTDPHLRRELITNLRLQERSNAHVMNQQGLGEVLARLTDEQLREGGLLDAATTTPGGLSTDMQLSTDASCVPNTLEPSSSSSSSSSPSSPSSSSSVVAASTTIDSKESSVDSKSPSSSSSSSRSPSLLRVLFHMVHAPVFVRGRYLKLSREVSQSPWNKAHMERLVIHTNVEDELMGAILPQFGPGARCKFASSGREDLNVRMLGKGRPFFLKIDHISQVPAEQQAYAAMEAAIDAHSEGTVRIVPGTLSFSDVSAYNHMNRQVEHKRKRYVAVIHTEALVTQALVDARLALVKLPLRVAQQTPVRVLHTRSLMTREKWIHAIEARVIGTRFFVLTLETSSGTYVKEFCHGDRGRTSPSLKTLLFGDALGQAGGVDILQLDVTDIY
jgi:hypothetical protein